LSTPSEAAEAISPQDLLLAGDVGGTKTNLGLFDPPAGGTPRLLRSGHYASPDFPGLAPMLAAFLGTDGARVGAACFGVPGPVVGNRTQTPNLAWELDGAEISQVSGIPAVRLINDLVATAEGIPLLGTEDLAVLHPGDPAAAVGRGGEGNRVLIAAGTGLGMSLLPWIGGRHVPVASEGGHMDFAPRNALEVALASTLGARYGRVSVERVVSGPGLQSLYEHLRGNPEARETPEVVARLGAADDPSRVIAEAALAGESPLCVRALDLFASAYGAAAGNLALVGTATGGVYVGGGIAPKILPKLLDGTFLQAFLDKGRFRSFLAAIPVRVILNDRAAMFGAASVAARLGSR
jgi:glucokinase